MFFAYTKTSLPSLRELLATGLYDTQTLLVPAGFRVQDAGCSMQDTRYMMQDAGCKMQDSGRRMQVLPDLDPFFFSLVILLAGLNVKRVVERREVH
jgi:hypothetical protein